MDLTFFSNEEKYDLIETQSLKDRCLKFMDYLLKQKQALKLQFELAERLTEKANKNYRETVLREQLKENKFQESIDLELTSSNILIKY